MMTGKSALVTGASRGIGRAAAIALARAGCNVAVNYVNNEGLALNVCAEIEQHGVKAVALQADVADSAQAVRLVGRTAEALGSLDVLVNNAGITRDGLVGRMKDEDFKAVIDTNLMGAFYCTRAALKGMARTRWGRIISVSSVVGQMGNAGQANYAAAKAGLIGFTKSVGKEMAARGITANCVAPGFIETDMTGELNAEAEELYLSVIPQKRFGTPEDVAAVIAFLASDAAAYVTGQVIGVDGGMNM